MKRPALREEVRAGYVQTVPDMATDRPDSPHVVAAQIKCDSYFACAETDVWAPPADIEKLQASLLAAGVPHRIEWYPGVEHGFVFPQRGAIYNQTAAERHWERLFALFARTLGSVRAPASDEAASLCR